MIGTLRRKLIAACMFSLATVLLVILGGVNLASYQKVVADADAVLAVLAAGDGRFPGRAQSVPEQSGGELTSPPEEKHLGGRGFSPETPYESRFFSVLLDSEGRVLQVDTGQIAAVDDEEAADAALAVLASGRTAGFEGDYRYLRSEEEQGVRIIFLDCGRSLSGFRMTLLASVVLAAIGLGAVLVLLLVLSRRIVRPMAENQEKQRRFITDAGHELKTPLTIIGADVDLAEMDCGENQWLEDIRRQTRRLTGLTNDLIYLSRMEEEQPRLQYIPFPLSDVAEEMAGSFLAPAKSQGKELEVRIQPMLSFTGDEKAVRQLISLLLDNALKYSPAGGKLAFTLEKQGRNLVMTVFNTTARPVDRERLSCLFDRFYRADEDRSTDTGGYGLGLAIARGIVTAHKGRIRAESADGASLAIQVTLPAQGAAPARRGRKD